MTSPRRPVKRSGTRRLCNPPYTQRSGVKRVNTKKWLKHDSLSVLPNARIHTPFKWVGSVGRRWMFNVAKQIVIDECRLAGRRREVVTDQLSRAGGRGRDATLP